MPKQKVQQNLTPPQIIQLEIFLHFRRLIKFECPENRTFRYCLRFQSEDSDNIDYDTNKVYFHPLVRRLQWVLYCAKEVNREGDAQCYESEEIDLSYVLLARRHPRKHVVIKLVMDFRCHFDST